MTQIRKDKFQIGDMVQFIEEDIYVGIGMADKHAAKHGPGPYKIEEIESAEEWLRTSPGIGHTQMVEVNGERYSGYWFRPIDRQS